MPISLSRSCSPTRQTMFFSATLTTEVEGLAQISLKKPARLFLDSNKVRLSLDFPLKFSSCTEKLCSP